MSKWDVFYSEYIGYKEHAYDSKTITGAGTVTLTAAGMEVTVSSNTNFSVGSYVQVTEAAHTTAYCIVAGNLTSNRLRLIQAPQAPTDAIGTAYTLGTAVVTMWRTPIARLRVDLSDAPPDVTSYKYLILGAATASRDSTGHCKLLITGPSDPYGESSGSTYQSMAVSSPSASDYQDRPLFNCAFSDTVTAGSSKEYVVWADSGGSTRVRVDAVKLVAYRVDSNAGMFLESGTGLASQSTVTATGAGATADVCTISSGSITSETHYTVAACSVSCTVTGDNIVTYILRGATEYANTRYYAITTSDEYSFGYIGKTTTPSSSTMKLRIASGGASGNVSAKSYYMAVFTAAAIPAWGTVYGKTTTGDQTTVTSGSWGESDITAAQSVGGSMCMEIVCSDIRSPSSGDRWKARLRVTSGPGVFMTQRGMDWGTTNRIHGFMFRRYKRVPGESITSALDLVDATASSKSIIARNTSFLIISENGDPDLVMPLDTYKTIVAHIESGQLLKNWRPQGTTDVYQKYLADTTEVTRVIRNSTECTMATSAPSWGGAAQDTAYWDPSTKMVYIKMPTTKQPSDYDQTVIVVSQMRVSRNAIDLQSASSTSTYYKYLGRAKNIPGASTNLDVRGGGAQTSFTIGNFDLINTDGYFKNMFGGRIWEGLRARVLIGYEKMNPNIGTFKTILYGILGIPQSSNDTFKLKLFDRSVILQKPLATVSVTVFVGGNSTSAFAYQEKQVLPILFGEKIKRTVAYRVSNFLSSGSDYNFYKYAANPCKTVTACYADDSTEKKVTFTDEDPGNGIIKVQNSVIDGYDATNRLAPDVLYVDVTGETDTRLTSGTALKYPGEIAYAAITRYPIDIDASFGTAYTIAGGGFTLSDSGSMSVTISGGTSTWQYGDRLLAIDGSKQAHLQIIKITSSTVYTMIPLHEPGDSQDGTVFSTSGTIKECVIGTTGIPASHALYATFKNVDSGRWRSQLQNGVLQLLAPKINIVINGSMSASDTLNEICRISFLYWYINRIGRIGIGLPDEDFGNLLLNPGFEWDPSGEWYWPWRLENGATATLSSTRHFEGYRAIELSNQSSLTSRLSQDIVFDRPGKYVATAMVSLKNGNGTACRIGIIPPGKDRMFVSDPVIATNSQWSRATLKFEIKPGILGTGRFFVVPYAPSDLSVTNPQYTTNLARNFGGDSLYGWYTDGETVSSINDMSVGSPISDVTGDEQRRMVYEKNPFNHNRPMLRAPDTTSGTSYISGYQVSHTAGYSVSFIWCWDGRSDRVERTVWGIYGSTFRVGILGSGGNYGFNFYDGTGYGSVFTSVTPGMTYLVTVTHSVSGGNMTTEMFINGTSTSTRTAASNSNTGYFEIRACGGWLGQIVTYDESLSSTNRAIVEAYLQDRWGCTATTVVVDNCQVFKVSAYADDVNSDFGNMEYNDEIYPEARVTYDVNVTRPESCGAQIASDVESQLLTKSISEGKNAIQTAKRLDISAALVKDAASASGIAAAAAGFFGRQRQSVNITLLGQDEIPELGEKIYIDMTQTPEFLDGNKLWRVTGVDYSGDNAHAIEVTAERQIDSVADRVDISPTEVPLGAIVLTNASGAITGFVEMSALQDYYVAGSATADTITVNGSYTHTHTMNHSHSVPTHSHTFSLGTLNYVAGLGQRYNSSVGPLTSVSSDNHTHSNSSSGHSTQSSSGTFVSSTASITSNLGPNDPKHYRVRFMKRTGDVSTYFSTDMIVGYLFNAVPSGWTRVTAMDTYYIRGATSITGVSTTLTATYTKSDTSTSMAVTSSANMKPGMVLVLNSNIHVVVDSVVDTTHVMVRALNWTSDASSASSTNTVTSANETVGNTYTPSNHDHTGAISSHTHTLDHAHIYPSADITISTSPSATTLASGGAIRLIATSTHGHTIPASSNQTLTDSVTSSVASGSAVSSTTPVPDVIKLVWMKPSGGTVSEFPSGAIIFWDGSVCPTGYTRLASADNLLIGTADAGADSSSVSSGHSHTFTAASHTGNHTHSNVYASTSYASAYTPMASGSGSSIASADHAHTSIASSFSTASITLASITGLTSSTSSGSSSMPPYKKLLLCKKD